MMKIAIGKQYDYNGHTVTVTGKVNDIYGGTMLTVKWTANRPSTKTASDFLKMLGKSPAKIGDTVTHEVYPQELAPVGKKADPFTRPI